MSLFCAGLRALADGSSLVEPGADFFQQEGDGNFSGGAVQIWFSILQGKSLLGASFTSVAQLRAHIDAFIEVYNDNAKPFVWTKTKVHQRRVKGRRISEL